MTGSSQHEDWKDSDILPNMYFSLVSPLGPEDPA